MRVLFLFAALSLGTLAISSISGQSPAPVIIQAATPAPAAPAAAAPAAAAPATTAADPKQMTQLLQEMQATNAATIKKQEAALQTLDGLQKAAEEIKIYSKRG
ncbi:MAG: hypothetical protein H0X34_00135 [Chthoniobacterales bacterium]|nr:hypothetical protein [Chthoniobacterales bacterium]